MYNKIIIVVNVLAFCALLFAAGQTHSNYKQILDNRYYTEVQFAAIQKQLKALNKTK